MNITVPNYPVSVLSTLTHAQAVVVAGAVPGGCVTEIPSQRTSWSLHLCVDDTDISREITLKPSKGVILLGTVLVAAARFAQETGLRNADARRVSAVEINTFSGTINVELT